VKALYTAVATATDAGRNGRTRTDDGKLDLELSMPEGMGGPGGDGTNPEQLFAAGYAACFANAMRSVARRAGDERVVDGARRHRRDRRRALRAGGPARGGRAGARSGGRRGPRRAGARALPVLERDARERRGRPGGERRRRGRVVVALAPGCEIECAFDVV
jgi:hypothetical protein